MSSRPTDTTPSLLPPGSTTLERDLEQVTARMANVPTPFDTLWNADTCPVELLGWLAWALSVDEWDAHWPEDVKREAIRISPLLHRRKGTLWALENALKPIGATTQIEEWWQMKPMGEPGTFRATTTVHRTDVSTTAGTFLTPELYKKIKAVITHNKPVSRPFTLRVGAAFQTYHREVATLRPAQRLSLCMVPQ